MTVQDFDDWAPRSVEGFVSQQLDAGLLPLPEARARAHRIFAALLPQGLRTPGHRLMTVWPVPVDGVCFGPVAGAGHVWLRLGAPEALLVDIDLDPGLRGRGLGTATLLATEDLARGCGARQLSLTVFTPNAAALALYDRLGYAVTDHTVVVDLGAAPDLVPPDLVPPDLAAPHLTSPGPLLLRDMTVAELDALRPATAAPVDLLLPEGPATGGHRLWTAYAADDPATPVGRAWLQLHHRSDGLHATVVHAEVLAPRRGRGHGPALAAAVVRGGRDLGVRSVTATVPAGAAVDAVLSGLPHRSVAQTRSRLLGPRPGVRPGASPDRRGLPGERAPGR